MSPYHLIDLINRAVRPSFIFAAALLLTATGCSSTPKTKATNEAGVDITASPGMSAEAVLKHEDVKGKVPTPFPYPVAKVREAALRSLVTVGCEIQKREPYYVSGRRPNKFGLFVGSGGETVEIFLYPKTETETDVWIDTDMSFVGIAGQQGWNDQVKQEMTSLLSQPSSNP